MQAKPHPKIAFVVNKPYKFQTRAQNLLNNSKMDCLDLTKVTCRICVTGDESNGKLSNLFNKKISEIASKAIELIDDDELLNMLLIDALESFTCIELQKDNGLPETICRNCESQLTETIIFIHRARDTQQILNSCARISQEAKVEPEDIDLNEDSTYLIEVLNEEGEVLVQDEYDEKLRDENEDKESDCDAEDAVSFLKNAKRDDIESDAAGKTFKQKTVRKNHSCNYCKKRFLRKSNLVDHLRLHANVRPFQCTYCDKSFVQSGNLKSHLRTHTKERPFQCLLCTKSYSQSSALKVHYRTHTNERNYGCDICSKHFTNASDLTKHKRIHDPDSKIACEYCDRKFAQRVNYRNHLRSNHSVEEIPATNVSKKKLPGKKVE